jgi:hypothetical protein
MNKMKRNNKAKRYSKKKNRKKYLIVKIMQKEEIKYLTLNL